MTYLTADLSLSQIASDLHPQLGDPLTFTVTLTNHGPDASNVQVTDVAPAGLSSVTITPSDGTSYDASTGIWTIPNLAGSGALNVATLTITGIISDTDQTITNTAEVTASDRFDPDSTPNNGSTTEDDLTGFSVVVVNHAPVISDQGFNLAENTANGILVGTVAANDPDMPTQTLAYSITAGNYDGAFAINPANGQITVADASKLDFETTSVFHLAVQVTDDGEPALSGTAAVTVNLTDENEPPIVGNQTFSIAENTAADTLVGTVPASDPDEPAQTLTYSITAGNDSGAFAINPASGQITVADASKLDFETTPVFHITVQVADNGTPALSNSVTVTVNLTDVNDSPLVPNQTFSIVETADTGALVGTVAASDADRPVQTLAYSITAGNDAGAFVMDGTTGRITVADASKVNGQSGSVYQLTVQVTDDGTPTLSGTGIVTVNVTSANVPPIVDNQTFSVAENTAAGALVGTVLASDPDTPVQTLTYSITAGNDAGAFAINPANGQITVADATKLDFETTSVFHLTVQVADSGTPALSSTATATVNLTDVNESPVVGNQTFSIAEDTAAGTLVGTVPASDPDTSAQTFTYSITAGNDSGAFAINSSSGQITVADASKLDFEATSAFHLTVQVADNGTPALSSTATVTVNLTDVNESPVVGNQTLSIAENAAAAASVGTVTASDPDRPAQALAYTIVAGNTDGVFLINANTGQIVVAKPGQLDFETTPVFHLTVHVADNGTPALFSTATVTVNLTDLNESPVAGNQTFSIAENAAAGTLVGTVTASDPDRPAQTLTHSITGGNTGGAFAINPSSGRITVADATKLNFETGPVFHLTVQVADNGTSALSTTATITVNLTDVNESPVVGNQTVSIAEISPAGTLVGTVTASDPDRPAQTLTYSITGGNTGGAFAINASTGQITVADSTELDYAITPVFQLTVRAVDNGSPSLAGSALVTVNLTPVQNPPEITSVQAPTIVRLGNRVTVASSYSDADFRNTHVAWINWGDGTGSWAAVTEAHSPGTVAGSHVYRTPGVYTVTVELTSSNGQSAVTETTTAVAGVAIHDRVLQVVGTSGYDVVQIARQYGRVRVAANFLQDRRLLQGFATSAFDRIEAYLFGGNDRFTVAPNVTTPVFVDWGTGTSTKGLASSLSQLSAHQIALSAVVTQSNSARATATPQSNLVSGSHKQATDLYFRQLGRRVGRLVTR